MYQSLRLTHTYVGVARGVQGVQVHPRATEKNFCRQFWWNEAKMGLNLVRCTPQVR